jgi:folate-binding protein YgfZ
VTTETIDTEQSGTEKSGAAPREGYLSPLLALPGAVDAGQAGQAGASVDHGVALHYGDPLGEQRRALRGAALVDRSNREVLAITGPDRLPWLHSICSQHVSDLREGEGAQSLVLSPNGHVEQHWIATELGDQLWLDTEPAASEEVLGYLLKMRFMKRVEPERVTASWAVLSLVGPQTDEVLAAAGLAVPPQSAYASTPLPGGGFVRRMPDLGAPVVDLLVPRGGRGGADSGLEATARRLLDAGAGTAGTWTYDALRVGSMTPRLRFETDHRTIPHEVEWIGSAVHLNKGCYRGQETVARVHNLGKPPRRLVQLHLSGESDVLPVPGTPIEFGGRTVGFLGTAVHHHELGPVALAVIKRSLPDDAVLSVDGSPATIAPPERV